MYTPQQLYQYIQYAMNYLSTEDFEYKDGDTLLNPNNEEDMTRLISVALAEHRDGDVPTGFAQNVPGDQGRSRGPWQVYGTTWESELRKYDIFNSYDNINDALDDPGLNAIAAVIIGQYDEGDRTGIDNWTTNKISGQESFLNAAKEYDTNVIENPTQIQTPDGNVQEVPTDPTVEGYENSVSGRNLMDVPEQSIASMKRSLVSASLGGLFKNEETYLSYKGNRVRENRGSDLNNMTKNMLANVNLDTLSNQQIMQMYVENVHPYLPLDVTYRGVNVQGDGQNIVDLLQNKKLNPNDNYYIHSEGRVATGKEINKRLDIAKSTMYQYYLNKKGTEPTTQLQDVYEYIFRTIHPYVKVAEDVEVSEPRQRSIRESRQGQEVYLLSNSVRPTKAAPTFLNNMEKILRVKPQGNRNNQPQERNMASRFLDR